MLGDVGRCWSATWRAQCMRLQQYTVMIAGLPLGFWAFGEVIMSGTFHCICRLQCMQCTESSPLLHLYAPASLQNGVSTQQANIGNFWTPTRNCASWDVNPDLPSCPVTSVRVGPDLIRPHPLPREPSARSSSRRRLRRGIACLLLSRSRAAQSTVPSCQQKKGHRRQHDGSWMPFPRLASPRLHRNPSPCPSLCL